MVARLEKTQHGFSVPLTAEMVEALHLAEGSAVEVLPAAASVEEPRPQVQYASVEEVMQAYRDTLRSTKRHIANWQSELEVS